uniref:Amino acid transporter transmembrane domain-containing protein n=1 Tax=Ciona savignyi TaxID=51511 RepID=H2Z6U1_CIOSA
GLTVITAVLFITGEMTGSGVLALPKAVKDAGWVGLFLIFMCAGISSFTGTVLGRCWTLLRDNKPELKGHCSDPYPTIGYNTFGRPGKIIVNISVYFTLYGVCVVLLLIASGNIQSLLAQIEFHTYLMFAKGIPVNADISLFLAPFCWLKSPKDFWPIALGATVTTAIACVLIFIQAIMDIKVAHNRTVEYRETHPDGFESFFLAFGMILFCFGGMAAFPTIQADMREPERFPKAVIVAMGSILCMYIPVGAIGFSVYGDLVADNIFDSLSQGPMKTIATILITMHLVFAYVIIQNPLSQVFEMPLNLPDEFGWKRVLVRTSITLVVIFTAESCPRFGHILALVGGSAVTLNTFVFPSIFFWRLTRLHGKEWDNALKFFSTQSTNTAGSTPQPTPNRRYMPKRVIPFHVTIITIGVIGGISATYSAIRGITDPAAFVPPCYVNITAASYMGVRSG